MFEYGAPHVFAGRPFTPRQVPRKLKWLQSGGQIRQLVKGVYVDVRVPDSRKLRAEALQLVVPPEATVCGAMAAWLHGIESTTLGPEPLLEPHWTFQPRPTVELHGLRVTSPAATAIELAQRLPRPFALSALDALLHRQVVTLDELHDSSIAYFAHDSRSPAALLLRLADGRAASPGESWLRLRLFDAGFPRPELQVPVDRYRLDLGYPDHPIDGRRLGLEYDSDAWHSSNRQQIRDATRRTDLERIGWHIIPIRRPDIWGSYPALELTVGAFLCQHPRLPRRW
ncbi:endonuclease domain-containing protein [Kribbella sp. NPDC056345]|uniref:endonuclease domain-containing protein n=1 Tax=Kribbella sp. NPDC056345 TaxID=3345789 RepID=UPI0035D95028